MSVKTANPTEPAAQPQGGELLPCPFCGARARLTIVAEHLAPAENGFPVHVECGGTASCFSHYFVDESAAIKFWNTRADPPRATAGAFGKELVEAVATPWICVEEKPCEEAVAVHWDEMITALTAMYASRTAGETTVEAALVELWEIFPKRWITMTCATHSARALSMKTIWTISVDQLVDDFEGPTLADCMAQVRATRREGEGEKADG